MGRARCKPAKQELCGYVSMLHLALEQLDFVERELEQAIDPVVGLGQ